MFKFNPFKRKTTAPGTANENSKNACRAEKLIENQLEIKIGDVLVKIERRSDISPRNELSAFIPRAEIRHRCYENGKVVAEEEIILSSITLVDSPCSPLEGTGFFSVRREPILPKVSETPSPPR